MPFAHRSPKSFRLGANYALGSFIKAGVSVPTPKARDSRPETSGLFILKRCSLSDVYRKRVFGLLNSREQALTTLDENIKMRSDTVQMPRHRELAGAGRRALFPSSQFTGEGTVRDVFPLREARTVRAGARWPGAESHLRHLSAVRSGTTDVTSPRFGFPQRQKWRSRQETNSPGCYEK